MQGSMVNVSYGTVENGFLEINTIHQMEVSAGRRRLTTWIKAFDKGDEITQQRMINIVPPGCTPVLHWAILRAGLCGKSKWDGTFYKLIAAGTNLHERDDLGSSVLHEAAAYGCLEIMKWLLENSDIDPNLQNSEGETPLHYAALYGHLGIVRLLLKFGADPNIQNHEGKIPLNQAIEGRKKMWRKNPSERLKRQRKELSVGSKRNYDKIIRLL
jgi:hypothetical protein